LIGADEENFRFVAVEFEEFSLRPGLDICEAVCEGGVSGASHGCGRDVELGVVGITVEMEPIWRMR